MDEIHRDYLRVSQARTILNQSTNTLIFPAFAAAALCWLLWDVSSRYRLLAWTGIIIFYSFSRCWWFGRYRCRDLTPANARRWLDVYTLGVLLSGLLWGLAVIILIPLRQEAMIEFTLNNSLMILVICGLVTGAVLGYTASLQVVLGFAVPCLLPSAMYLIYLGDKYNSALGGFILLYLAFVSISAYHLNRQFLYYLKLEYELDRLKQGNDLIKSSRTQPAAHIV